MFAAYMLQYLDKSALGNTAIFGIQESLVETPEPSRAISTDTGK
jgi:hypothetical protein